MNRPTTTTDYCKSNLARITECSGLQQAGIVRRRYYDFTYVFVVLLAFPLYWVKAVDWRLCSEAHSENDDPWLIQPPSPRWIELWPCNGSQLAKLAYMLMSPGPFVRSLVWPISYSELHFCTSFYVVFLGGLLMLAVTHGTQCDMSNPCRLTWAFAARAQLRFATLLVKVLRPRTPWPLTVSQSLPLEGPGNLMFSVALMGPVWLQVLGAVIDVSYTIIVCRMYGSGWPYAMSQRSVVLLQAACGILGVVIATIINRDSLGNTCEVRQVLPADESKEVSEVGLQTRWYGQSQSQGLVKARTTGGARRRRLAQRTGLCGPDSPKPAQPDPVQALETPCAGSGQVTQEVVANGGAAAGVEAAASELPDAPSQSAVSCQPPPKCYRLFHCLMRGGATCPLTSNTAASAQSPREDDGEHCCSVGERVGALTWTHLRLKLQNLETWQLRLGFRQPLAAAVALVCPGAIATNIAVRYGCVEIHLDLVRCLSQPVVVATAAAAAGGRQIVADSALATELENVFPTISSSTRTNTSSLLAPASVEQQDLASSILEALGLPPGYNASVRAQIGSHLLTLTPAAEPSDGWAVLGTRRMQTNEVPWVFHVQPPGVVAALADAAALSVAAPDGSADATVPALVDKTLRMTICGSGECLSAMREDKALEVLALFEGTFLCVSDLQWEQDGCQAAAAPAAAAPLERLSLEIRQHVLMVTVALPAGKTGAVSLMLMRHGVVGQGHPLLLLKPQDGAIIAEVSTLQMRIVAPASEGAFAGPSTSSVTSFVQDLGHWLQYREFWLMEASAANQKVASIATVSGRDHVKDGSSDIRAGRHARRITVSWMGALLTWSRWCREVSGGGRSVGLCPQLQPPWPAGSSCPPRISHDNDPEPAVKADSSITGLQVQGLSVQVINSDLLDEVRIGTGAGRGESDVHQNHHAISAAANGEAGSSILRRDAPQSRTQVPSSRLSTTYSSSSSPPPRLVMDLQRQQLADDSLHPFGQMTYQNQMWVARRTLLEFALEQRCAAIAAALLEPAPLPPPPSNTTIAAAWYRSASYLEDLFQDSLAASPDRLTLLHRAVRGGDAVTVDVLLAAAAAVASTASQTPAAQYGDGPADSQRRPGLFSWSTPDAHGISPLHYAAVLADSGALVRHVLSTHPEALTLWEMGSPDMPSPADFAAHNGTCIDMEMLRRECLELEPAGTRPGGSSCISGGEGSGSGCHTSTKPHRTQPLFLAAMWGFSSGNLERGYQQSSNSRQQRGAPALAWLLLLLHLVTCAGGLCQALGQQRACYGRGMLALVMLQGGSYLLALCCSQSACLGNERLMGRVIVCALQVLALAVLLAKTIGPLPRRWPFRICNDLMGVNGYWLLV